jgi:hypothetical protein
LPDSFSSRGSNPRSSSCRSSPGSRHIHNSSPCRSRCRGSPSSSSSIGSDTAQAIQCGWDRGGNSRDAISQTRARSRCPHQS